MKTIIKIIFTLCALALCQFTYAAGFQSLEQSAATLGNANAGTTVTRDSSLVFYNPAAMAFIPNPVISASGIIVAAHSSMNPITATTPAGLPVSGTNDGPGQINFVPALYAVYPVNDSFAIGIGAASPFGLSTKYDTFSVARYFATESSITTIDIMPAMAIKVMPNLAFGLGLDVLYADAKLNQGIDANTLTQGIIPNDVFINNNAKDWGVGWHAGIYYQVTPDTRFGIAYHSQISLGNLHGDSRAFGVPSALVPATVAALNGLVNSKVSTDITLPDYATISARTKLKPWWIIMGDVSFVNWHDVQKITLTFSPSVMNPTPRVLPPQTLNLKYHDTWRVALGQSFVITPKWLFRMGVAYDQTPVRYPYRDARLPDTDRFWLSVGSHFVVTKMVDLDVGYAHIFFFGNGFINQANATLPAQRLVATYDTNANLFGAQINVHFNS